MTPADAPTLGLIAGGGDLPRRLAAAARAAGRPVAVVLLEGFAEPAHYAHLPHAALRFGQAPRMLEWLRGQGARQIVMAGRVSRPSLLSLRPDAGGLSLLARIGRASFGGDDSLLTAVIRVLGEEGFEVVGAQQVLAGLLPSPGLLSVLAPDDLARADVARGLAVLDALGPVDVGQAVVVQQGLVLGVEAIEGTDALLARCGGLRREGPGGVLVKRAKPGQSPLADLPAIGPATLRAAHAAGLRGVAVGAADGTGAGTIVVDRDATAALADALGLFLAVVAPAAPPPHPGEPR